MLHVTCDLCGKELQLGDEPGFIVKIEIYAAHDPSEITEADLDEDHMEAVSQMLRDMDDAIDDTDLTEANPKSFRYDLCHGCRNRYVRDPLSKEGSQKLHFSEN